VVHECPALLGSDIVDHYGLLSLVSTPPLVNKFLVMWVLASGPSLPCSWGSPEPVAFFRFVAFVDSLMVFFYTFNLVVAAYVDVGGYLVYLSFLGMLSDLLPVCLTLSGDGLGSVL